MDSIPQNDSHGAATTLLLSGYELGQEPLGLIVPAAVLGRAGVGVRVQDLSVTPLDDTLVRAARLVAISAPMYTGLRLGMAAARRVRALNPRAHIAFYGLYAGLNRRHLVPALADSAFGAEFEMPLLELARRIAATDGSPRTVAVPDDARPSARSPARATSLLPSRDSLAHRAHYAHLALGDERREAGYVQTTRGCKHMCRHCPLPPAYDGTFYAIPADDVLRDIDAVVTRGARHITFADPDFLNGPGHALRIARAMAARHPGLTFDYTAKIEHLLRLDDAVAELHHLGNVFVVSAVESMNDTVLQRLDKGHTRADAIAVARRFAARGLTLRPSLMPFTPWETRDSLADLIDVVVCEGLADAIDPVQYSIRLLLPEGSLLLDDADVRAALDEFDEAAMGWRWHHADRSMDELHAIVSATVARAAEAHADPLDTFERVRGVIAPDVAAVPAAAAGPRPRLTEEWFC
jgi:radical SAM superfamily enzyme YgiQ (UPF0313 family)